ncbi:hypothetical protein B0H11DRAFT_2250283 [Mycena galericulata]|nr:hypothetical protein B0H11DRAFT_2250283 [Mycena galericulata]
MVAVEVGVPSPSARRVERSGEDGASRFYSSAVRIHLHSSISIAPVSRSCPPPANNNCCCAKSTCLARRRMTKRYVLCLDPHPPIPILTPHSILRSKHCDPHSRNTRQRAYTVTVPSLDWCTLYRASLDLDHRWEGKADAASPPWEPRATALEGHADSVYCLELSRTRQPREGASSELFAAWAPGDGETRLHVGPVDGAPGRGRTWRVAACWICGWTSGGLVDGTSKDTAIRLWALNTLALHHAVCGHEGPVNAVRLQSGDYANSSGTGRDDTPRQVCARGSGSRRYSGELVDDGTHGRQCKRRGQGLRVAGAIGALKSSLLYAHLRLNCISGDDERMSERSSEHEFRGRGVLERRLSLACRPCEVFHSVRLIAMSSMDDPYGTDRFLKSSVAAAHAMSEHGFVPAERVQLAASDASKGLCWRASTGSCIGAFVYAPVVPADAGPASTSIMMDSTFKGDSALAERRKASFELLASFGEAEGQLGIGQHINLVFPFDQKAFEEGVVNISPANILARLAHTYTEFAFSDHGRLQGIKSPD